jgi:hypothetical protein
MVILKVKWGYLLKIAGNSLIIFLTLLHLKKIKINLIFGELNLLQTNQAPIFPQKESGLKLFLILISQPGTDRYLTTTDNKSVRDVASNALTINLYFSYTNEYGGGAIYNYYSVCVNNNRFEEQIFVHEFGHGFASLADEYVTEDVSYQNFYELDIEPTDPNLTTLVDFNSKWKICLMIFHSDLEK